MPFESQPLDSPYGKMLRAVQHMDALQGAIATWVGQKPYRLLHQFDPQTGWNRWVVANRLPMPALIPLIFGDYVGCLRASLDHLVAAIVRLEGKTPTRAHQFPILHDQGEWGKRIPRALADVPSDVVERIEALQPYHHPEDPNRHRVAALNNFANADKHRLLHAAAITTNAHSIGFPLIPGVAEVSPPPERARIEDGVVMLALRFDPPSEYPLNGEAFFDVGVAFELDELSGRPVPIPMHLETVQWIMAEILPLVTHR